MVNKEKFIERMQKILADNQLSASQFADEIGVPRSSISHLLSGRNKPSLEFVLKVIEAFPTLTLDELLFGKATQKESASTNPPIDAPLTNPIEFLNSESTTHSKIEKIVVFYKNGSFKEYLPQ